MHNNVNIIVYIWHRNTTVGYVDNRNVLGHAVSTFPGRPVPFIRKQGGSGKIRPATDGRTVTRIGDKGHLRVCQQRRVARTAGNRGGLVISADTESSAKNDFATN